MANAFFSDLLSTIADQGRLLLGRLDWSIGSAHPAGGLSELCEALVSGRGEASGIAIAREALERYRRLSDPEKIDFFMSVAKDFGPAPEALRRAVEAWRSQPDPDTAGALHFAAEPRCQELFRRLNRAPGGTDALVRMREALLEFKRETPGLAIVDRSLSHLLASWFNRGFLVLRRIDWSTPANVLEKIIRYEAVHAIRGWDDLRRRIDPVDRRCYAFFHPALVDEPLIFVEVALTDAMPGAIAPLLAESRDVAAPDKARTAVFYSISNCQQGLQGISFGNFLIKQVVEELRRELPKVDSFVTLSPVPGFMRWLRSEAGMEAAGEPSIVETLADSTWALDAARAEALRKPVEALAADYFLNAKGRDGRSADSVARFHLGNGARLERVNWLGDLSENALRDGAGLMVNYLYDLDAIEANHEAYANFGVVAASTAVKRMARPARPRLQLPAGSSN